MTPNLNTLAAIISTGLTIWILCSGGLLCLFVDSLWPRKMTVLVYAIGIASLALTLVTAWLQWTDPALLPRQDLLVMDRLTLFVTCLLSVAGIFTLFNALGYIKINQTLTSEFCSLMLFSLAGGIFLFASNHLMVNFIGLETLSLATYVLVGSHKKNFKSSEAAIKYYTLGSVASAILLFGIALFYGAFGSLRLDVLASMITAPGMEYLPRIALALILVGIFFKIAVVPFHFWTPDVYEGAPSPVTGFMATGVKIAAFGFALRLFMALDVLAIPQIKTLLAVVVVATFVVANLVAILQDDAKRMLAYSSISHAGFLLFGILAGFKEGVYEPATGNAVLYYLAAYLLMTLGAFAVLSLLTREKSEATGYGDVRGLGKKHPLLALVFTVFMLSLIGMPGTVGFTAKYGVIALAVQNGHITLAVLAVIVSVISAYYYLRPSVVMFFADDTGPSVVREIPLTVTVVLTCCLFLVIYAGLAPDTFLTWTKIAAVPLK